MRKKEAMKTISFLKRHNIPAELSYVSGMKGAGHGNYVIDASAKYGVKIKKLTSLRKIW